MHQLLILLMSVKKKIEALVLTHVDYDHIQGALEGICRTSNDLLTRTVKKVYFNTCRGIRRSIKKDRKKFQKILIVWKDQICVKSEL